MRKILNKKEKGFTLLFAVLLSSLIVSIGATIISIALRQTLLSGTSRESQYAFYAANTILECASYWDVIGVPVEPGESGIVFPYEPTETRTLSLDDITCAGVKITDNWDIGTQNKTTFSIEIDDSYSPHLHESPYCAEATVIKTYDATDGLVKTRIEAKGYNTCDKNNSRRVERGLIQEYKS